MQTLMNGSHKQQDHDLDSDAEHYMQIRSSSAKFIRHQDNRSLQEVETGEGQNQVISPNTSKQIREAKTWEVRLKNTPGKGEDQDWTTGSHRGEHREDFNMSTHRKTTRKPDTGSDTLRHNHDKQPGSTKQLLQMSQMWEHKNNEEAVSNPSLAITTQLTPIITHNALTQVKWKLCCVKSWFVWTWRTRASSDSVVCCWILQNVRPHHAEGGKRKKQQRTMELFTSWGW